MMNMHQDIHGVCKVRATRLYPENSNSVSITVETEGGVLNQTLYFGHSTKAAGDAAALFYALKGDPANVVGSQAEAEAE